MARQPYSCGLDAATDVVGGRWNQLILWELHASARRLGEPHGGVSGIRAVPPRLEYSPTDLGSSLNIALVPLDDWSEEHMAKIMSRRRARIDSAAGEPAHTTTPRDRPRTGRNVKV